jgi:hypothetical protein
MTNKFLGCLGGILIYFLAKWAARLSNLHRIRQSLSPDTVTHLQPLFPQLDLRQIIIKDHANLPPNWFRWLLPAQAMAFGGRIYFLHTFNENDPRFLRLLIHELAHTEQVRRLGGEIYFACAYGRGHLEQGYQDNPLEVEARAFVETHLPSLREQS